MASRPLGPYTLAADWALRQFLGPPKPRPVQGVDFALARNEKVRKQMAKRAPVLRWYSTVKGPCVDCGRHAERREEFSVELASGARAAEVIAARGDLKRQAAAWRKQPIRHRRCEP